MAAPSFVQASTGATDASGTFTFTGVATGTVGDIVILQILVDGTGAISWGTLTNSNINNLAGSAGWTEIGIFFAGAAAQQRIFIGRRTSASSAPTFTASANTSGDDVYGRMYEFRDVSTGTTLAEVIENSTAGGTNTEGVTTSNTASDAAVTTLGPDRLALNFVGVNDDNAISAFTGETGGDWTLAVAPYADSGGTDGAIGLQISQLFTASEIHLGGSAGSQSFQDPTSYNAESFSAPATGKVTVYANLTKVNTPTDGVTVGIWTDSSGSPGTELGSVTVPASSITTGLNAFATGVSVTSGTTYWWVMRRSGVLDATNYYTYQEANADYAGGVGKNSTNSGGTWSPWAHDLAESIYIDLGVAGTIDGGTGSIVDSDAWGVVGFALIGTTPTPPTSRFPRNPAINFQDPAYV